MNFNLLTEPTEDDQTIKTLEIGNYGWPFEAQLPGDAPESVEGLPLSFILYRVTATVHMSKRSRDRTTSQHVRVIRTYFRDSLEFPVPSVRASASTYGSRVVANEAQRCASTWDNMIQYHVSTPFQSIIFGSRFQVDFSLVPLLKGLAITEISCRLVETQTLTVERAGGGLLREHEFERTICEEKWRLPDGTETEDIDGQEGYRTSGYLTIPKSLKQCLQSVEEPECGIKVVHRVDFSIELLRPNGSTCTVSRPRSYREVTVLISSRPITKSQSTFTSLQKTHSATITS